MFYYLLDFQLKFENKTHLCQLVCNFWIAMTSQKSSLFSIILLSRNFGKEKHKWPQNTKTDDAVKCQNERVVNNNFLLSAKRWTFFHKSINKKLNYLIWLKLKLEIKQEANSMILSLAILWFCSNFYVYFITFTFEIDTIHSTIKCKI